MTEPATNVRVRPDAKPAIPCAAVHPLPCVNAAIMRWYGQAFCPAHAPVRPARNTMYAWVRL